MEPNRLISISAGLNHDGVNSYNIRTRLTHRIHYAKSTWAWSLLNFRYYTGTGWNLISFIVAIVLGEFVRFPTATVLLLGMLVISAPTATVLILTSFWYTNHKPNRQYLLGRHLVSLTNTTVLVSNWIISYTSTTVQSRGLGTCSTATTVPGTGKSIWKYLYYLSRPLSIYWC